MKTELTTWLSLVITCLALTGRCGSTLSVRLVEASPKGPGTSAGLEDVADILARNLPFVSFVLQASQTVALPASHTASMEGYTVTCTGPQNALLLSIKRRNRTLISTILRLQDNTPVIVGGFPSANGKQIFVLVSQ